MEIIFNSLEEFKSFAKEMGYVKQQNEAPAQKQEKALPTQKKEKPAPKKEKEAPAPKKEEAAPPADDYTGPTTADELVSFVQEHFRDNVDPIKAAIANFDCGRLSQITDAEMVKKVYTFLSDYVNK